MPLKKSFLYHVYQQSKPGFVVIAVFLCIYGFLFYKKMDMLIFRYNSMFALTFADKHNICTYVVKADDQLIKITNKPYWKKDFLESLLSTYASYIKHNKRTYLSHYLQNKFSGKIYVVLSRKLIADSSYAAQFLPWYFEFASSERDIKTGKVKISLWQYCYDFSQDAPLLKDSVMLTEKYYNND